VDNDSAEIVAQLQETRKQGPSNMAMLILRVIFLCIAAGVASILSKPMTTGPGWLPFAIFSSVMFLALIVITVDILTPQKRIEIISAIYFGLLVGILLAYLLGVALTPILKDNPYAGTISILLAAVLCYSCVSLLIQTKDDFRFVIPYVEFVRELKGSRPIILDTSSLIDGRLAELVDTQVFDNQMIIPTYVLGELQGIADSSDKLRRVRGRRGLDILGSLQANVNSEVVLDERDLPEYAGQPVDMKLVILAKYLDAKIMTGDFNLNKVAKVHNVRVINLNEIANALRPQFLPGEHFTIRIVKAGEGPEQGVGYLDDGTMVVIEGGRNRINESLGVVVTSTLQTPAGRMIFTRVGD
jgi:uncharacterized protein YacL